MDTTTLFLIALALGLVLGLGIGWVAFARKRYKAARAAGLSRPQAIAQLYNGGGGPPKDP